MAGAHAAGFRSGFIAGVVLGVVATLLAVVVATAIAQAAPVVEPVWQQVSRYNRQVRQSRGVSLPLGCFDPPPIRCFCPAVCRHVPPLGWRASVSACGC